MSDSFIYKFIKYKTDYLKLLLLFTSKLFNAFPKEIRNITNCTVDAFKAKLDSYLLTVPDMPHLPGIGKFCRASSNSLIHMIPTYT